MQWRRLAGWFSFVAAPIAGLLGIVFSVWLEFGSAQTTPHIARFAVPILLSLLFASLLLLYAVFITMILTWDIDRISYAVEEEAQRQLLKRISSETQKSSEAGDRSEPGKRAPPNWVPPFDTLIARRAEFLWQQLLRSGCIDFPRADVKLAIKTIREEQAADNSGILDALKILVRANCKTLAV
jgi:hypothetical protein